MSSQRRDHTELRAARRALVRVKAAVPSDDASEKDLERYADELVKATATYNLLVAKALKTPPDLTIPCMVCGTEVKLNMRKVAEKYCQNQFDSWRSFETMVVMSELVNKETICSDCAPTCVVCHQHLSSPITSRRGLPVVSHAFSFRG